MKANSKEYFCCSYINKNGNSYKITRIVGTKVYILRVNGEEVTQGNSEKKLKAIGAEA